MSNTIFETLFTAEEINQLRADTPACFEKIHFNNAGASLMPTIVKQEIINYIELESKIGGYEAADKEVSNINAFYDSAANLLNCTPGEIAFTANATDSFSRALSSIPFKKDDVILTTKEDYISNQISYLAFAKRFGTKLVRAESLPTGGVDLNSLEECIKKYKPQLVAVTHIPTNSGLVQPVQEVGDLCERYETLYLVDGCQSVGQLSVDVKKIKCDFLSFTARKFLRGPRGAGGLYVSAKALAQGLEPLFIDMRGADWISDNTYIPAKDATRFEDWETAYALLLGTKAAMNYCFNIGINRIEQRVKFLSNYIRQGLREIDKVTVHDKGAELAGLVTFHLNGSDPVYIKKFLANKNINVAISIRNFAVIDYDAKKVDWTIRVSPHYYNTADEADRLFEAVREISTSKPRG